MEGLKFRNAAVSWTRRARMIAGTQGRPNLLMLPTSERDRLMSCRQSRSRRSGQLYRPVVVAMIAMRMVQPSTYEVIDVVPMGHGFVPAGRAMLVRAERLWPYTTRDLAALTVMTCSSKARRGAS